MGHSDMAIPEQQKEEFFKEMRESDAFKLGYCLSTIRTAIWYLDLGKVPEAMKTLLETKKLMEGGDENV